MIISLATPVFLPGESHGQKSLVGYSPRGHKESDTTKLLYSLRVFLISVIVLFLSVCLFFNFSRSFVNWFLHFLHFVFKVFDHLYYHYFELFSGSLPISSSFIWTSVFPSLLFHLCSISLPFHYFFNLLCLRSPFLRLQG